MFLRQFLFNYRRTPMLYRGFSNNLRTLGKVEPPKISQVRLIGLLPLVV